MFHREEIKIWVALFLHRWISEITGDSPGSLRSAWKWQGGVSGCSWEAKAEWLMPTGHLSHRLPKFPPVSTTLSLQASLFFTSCPAINWFIHSFMQFSLDAAFRIKSVKQLFTVSNLGIWPWLLCCHQYWFSYIWCFKTVLCSKSFYSLFYWVLLHIYTPYVRGLSRKYPVT